MEKEFETKCLIPAEKVNEIRQTLQKNLIDTYTQINLYIDTFDNYYKNNNSALRIRQINGKNELTLKQRTSNGNNEFNSLISNEQTQQIINGSTSLLRELNHPLIHDSKKLHVTKIVTTRSKYSFADFTFELDETIFDKVIDFEIEVEAKSLEHATKNIVKLLNEFNIEYKPSKPKIERYFIYNF